MLGQCSSTALAKNDPEGVSYLTSDGPIAAIVDANDEGRAWATCTAAYNIASHIMKGMDQPARAKQLSELANGASIAVAASLLLNGLTDNITPQRFNSLFTYSKVALNAWPETAMTNMVADAESLGSEGADVFYANIFATMSACMKNLDAQQAYVDAWRELAKSGLLKVPNQ